MALAVSTVEKIVSGALLQWSRARVVSWRPEEGDAVLYAASAAFAALTTHISGITLYQQWGVLAAGPYLAGSILSVILDRHHVRLARVAGEHQPPHSVDPIGGRHGPGRSGRVWVFVLVLMGATLLPLSFEVAWRSDGNPSSHVQPEVVVVEQAGHRAAHGKDPYREVTNRSGRVVLSTPGVPAYENFFPYLPLMTAFGLPSSTKEPVRLTDARIFFSIVTLLVVAGALAMCRAPNERKVRTLQVLTVLPTAALPLATGGDDMPVVALLLLAMVLAQRRKPFVSGLVLGVVSAMKFTAWPLAALALFAARDKDGRRAPWRMGLGIVLVTGPVVIPFILNGPFAFLDNVVLFPLGLSGVASPAASALPGHLLVTAFPSLHRVLPLTLAAVGAVVLVGHLVKHPPRDSAAACTLGGWVMLVAILFAPSTRIGYLLYPVNFFVWGRLLQESDAAAPLGTEVELVGAVDAHRHA